MTRAEIHQGILKAWDSVNWKATVQLTGSLGIWLAGIPVNRGIASADMVVGRKLTVVLYDPQNPLDAAVVSVNT